jgi:hypothetical protein
MKRGILALLTAVFLAGVGTVQAQLVEFDAANNDYVSANTGFATKPTSWKDWESAPAAYTTGGGPSFSYAGVDAAGGTLKQARVQSNDRFQLQESNIDLHVMVAFDFPATNVLSLAMDGSTFGPGANGSETYLLLHDSTQGVAAGWYATLIESNALTSTFSVALDVTDQTWHNFTPSTVDGTVPLGTIGSPVSITTITNKTFDQAGYYADVYGDGASGNHNHYLWYFAAFGPAAAPPAALQLDPTDELTLNVSEASSVVTNSIDVSYTEGPTAADVEITSVSVINQTHGGAFANITSLPLTLTSPAPATESVLVEFDNATAGLTPNQSASGIVEIIWNEVGSASSSTSSLPVSAIYPIGVDSIVAAFDHTFSTADQEFPGVNSVISGGLGLNSTYGSTDTTYGSVLGAAPSSKNAMGASVANPTVVVAITNTTPDTEIFFDSLNFDIGRRWNKAPNTVNVAIAGDIDNNAAITNHTGFTQVDAEHSDFNDFDVDLTGLTDRKLTYGESASFTFTFSAPLEAGNDNSVIALDNVALLGSMVSSTLLVTDPSDELAMNVDDALGVTTGTVAVSYFEASSLPTNVTITAVSVLNQSHGGFANANTNLPLTLNSPSPANEDVLIEFDNGTAGLSVGETATGIVEIVWKEVGSASSSTSSLPVSALFLEVHPGNTIAIFEHTGENANPRLGGLVAQMSGFYNASTGRGSTDGTYGSLAGDARTDNGCYQATLSSPVIAMAITNNTGYDCTFDSLHFDAAKGWAKGPGTVTVSISGDVTDGNLFTNTTVLPAFNGQPGDYPDFDIDLTGLGDRTLAHGDAALIEFTFSNGDLSNTNAISILDNIALLGSGVNGAEMTRVPGGWISMGVSGLSLDASEEIEMFYTEGDAETNVVITGVTFAEETHPGAFSYSGSLPLDLTIEGETNDIVTLLFDNTVANVPAGDYAHAVMQIAWNEKGVGTRTFEIDVYATRAAEVPEDGVIALLDTEFLTADAAVNGVLARMGGAGSLQYAENSSADGTYGSLATPAAPTGTSRWRVNGTEQVVTLSVTNGTVGDIVLSSLNFDIGRWWDSNSDEFTLSVSGNVTDTPALLVSAINDMGWPDLNFQDVDVDLTGLEDHTLSAGESLVFTITLTPKAGAEGYNIWIDNIALMGNFDLFGGWGAGYGLTGGVNDAPGDNPDGDTKDNLMEYATGSDPLLADGPAAASWQTADGGTNWFYHVHTERQDDASLSYSVSAKDNLIYSPEWNSTNVQFVGETTGPGVFKSVTNRTDMGSIEFIRLQVEQN